MKKLFTLLILLTTSSYASEPLKAYDEIFIGPVSDTQLSTSHFGVILKWKDDNHYGVFGKIKNTTNRVNPADQIDLLGSITINSMSLGAKIGIKAEFDSQMSLNYLDGKELQSLCGNYYGIQAGLSLWLGVEGFTTMNDAMVMIRSTANTGGVDVDLSGVTLGVTCLDEKNPNWHKTVSYK